MDDDTLHALQNKADDIAREAADEVCSDFHNVARLAAMTVIIASTSEDADEGVNDSVLEILRVAHLAAKDAAYKVALDFLVKAQAARPS